ncbi:MAG: hypothetical protein EOP04_03965 [Proteobacteria bacterium]|nr:MAG: hypothetical protein EOP04_03965 [Pseudomonadota bacterium]
MKDLTKFSGTIRFISLSPHGEVEGVVLDDSSFVKLPPHSVILPYLISVGSEVSGTGERLTTKPNAVFHHVLLKSGHDVLADDQTFGKKSKHTLPLKSKLVGKLVSIGIKPKGEVDRLIFDNGISVHLSKELDLSSEDMMIGQTYEVMGEVRSFESLTFCKADSVALLS